MNLPERVTVNPLQCGGRPCIRGMRIRVSDLLGLLGTGVSENEILSDFLTWSAKTCWPRCCTPPVILTTHA